MSDIQLDKKNMFCFFALFVTCRAHQHFRPKKGQTNGNEARRLGKHGLKGDKMHAPILQGEEPLVEAFQEQARSFEIEFPELHLEDLPFAWRRTPFPRSPISLPGRFILCFFQ